MLPGLKKLSVCTALLTVAVPAAFAQLERVGPTLTSFGYPAWYQDKTGLTLEFCSPLNQLELDGGYCLLLTGDTTAPEIFPTSFFDEHFYWAADALGTVGSSRLRLVLALEGAFGAGAVVAGDQIVFARIRVSITNLPFSGTYKVYTPYTEWTFPGQVAGDRLFFTEDIGIAGAPGDFTAALNGHVGPFLLPSAIPGGTELPAITGPVPGKLYIADPARIGPVTGSPLPPFNTPQGIRNHNIFRVEGPNGFLFETNDFTLMGRLLTNGLGGPPTIPGRVTVDRASYTQTPAQKKVDIFATGEPTAQGRLPGQTKPPAVTPVLTFYNSACGRVPAGCCETAPCPLGVPECTLAVPTGQVAFQMFNTGANFWGQSQPPAIPLAACIQDAISGAIFEQPVTDEVAIANATYNPALGGSLAVTAASSDQVNPATLTLVGYGNLTGGQVTVTPLAAPPAKVNVLSSHGGVASLLVTTALGTGGGGGVPVAGNDVAVTNEDTPATINVLANDTVNGAPIVFGPNVVVSIVAQPLPNVGTALVNTTTGAIQFTPTANYNGTGSLTYTVSVNGLVSSPAAVNITVNPVNDPPVAVNDSGAAPSNVATPINVLANDTDPDGQADLANAVNLTKGTAPLGAVWSITGGTGGTVTFTANTAGTYTFTYQAQDKGVPPLLSAPATVTMTVSGAETITVLLVEFRTTALRFRASGTDNVSAGQTLTIRYVNGTAAGTQIGTAQVINGAWTWDIRGATGILDPRTTGATQISFTSPLGGSAVANILIRP